MRLLSFIIAFLLLGGILYSQNNSQVDSRLSPLNLEESNRQQDYGFSLGLGQNFQGGQQFVQCPDCEFQGGAGFSFSLGVLYEKELFKGVRYGGQLLFNDFGFTSKFSKSEEKIDPESGVNLQLDFSHEAIFKMNAFTFAPYIKLYPWDFIFFRFGLPISYVFNDNIQHRKSLDNTTIEVSGIEYEVEPVDVIVEDGNIQDLNSLQLFLSTAIGFDFKLARNVYLSPLFEYYLPFTELSSYGDASKVHNWKLVFELRIALKESSY